MASQVPVPPSVCSSLVFIDRTVENYLQLVTGVTSNTEVILLDPQQDGIAQITSALANYQGISSLHIVSHGSPGRLRLGSAQLDAATLFHYRSQLQSWRSALAPDAEVLLYGCQVGAAAAGKSFLHQLQTELGASIAAASTPVGSADRGGSWDLDVAIGNITAPLAFEPETLATYAGVLEDEPETTVLLFEDFADAVGATPPPGWESVTLAGNPETDQWRFDDPGSRGIASFFDAPSAIYDSDFLSDDGVAESIAFVSPVFDASDSETVFLQFDQIYGGIAAGEYASVSYVEASTDGEDWEVVYSSNYDGNLFNSPLVDLTEELAGSETAQFRFRFDGDWSFLWAIDNVNVIDYLPPGVTVPTGTIGVSESNVPDPLDFTFGLESRPIAPVTLNFFVDEDQLLPIESLTFTPDNWNTPQTSTVAAVVDDIYEGEDVVSNVRVEVVSDDPDYAGLSVEDVPVQITETTIPGYTSYRTVEKTYSDLAALAEANPNLASWVDIGDSYDKTAPGGSPGYDIYSLEVGNKSTDKPGENEGKFGSKGKPVLFVQSTIHAREYTTTEAVTRFAEQLLAGYGSDANTTALLDFVDIRIVPIVNPDGRKFAEQGYSWRKNTNPGDGTAPFPSYGVDLNRNYAAQWGLRDEDGNLIGASDDPADLTYQGTGPFSEPESQAMRDYLLATLPEQKGEGLFDPAPADAPNIYFDVHSFGNLVLYPFGFDADPDTPGIEPAPNAEGLRNFGLKVGYFTGLDGDAYDVQQAYSLYPTSGTTDEWVYETFGNAAYTLELGTDFFENVDYFEDVIVPELLPAFFYAGQAAYAPYLASEGPDATNLSVGASGVAVKGIFNELRLTAIADDTRYDDGNGNSPPSVTEGLELPDPDNITGGRFSIDAPAWVEGTETYEMTAADGAFDESVERLVATIDVKDLDLAPGRHTAFVQGIDESGNYGAPTAIFFDVLEAPADAKVTRGTNDSDRITTGGENDVVNGRRGDDQISTKGGDDLVLAAIGNDTVNGGAGDDLLYGSVGDDVLEGGTGNDQLYGEAGADRLSGGSGDDLLWGGAGDDILRGGAGADTFKVVFGEGTDTIRDFEVGIDLLDLGGTIGFSQVSITQSGSDTLIGFQRQTLAILNGIAADSITEAAFAVPA